MATTLVPRLTIALAALTLIVSLQPLAALQSPTDTLIRLVDRRSAAASPEVLLVGSQLRSIGGNLIAEATVVGRTREVARRAARRRAYARMLDRATVPAGDLRALRWNTAKILADLSSLKEKLLHEQKTAEGYTVTVEVEQTGQRLAQDIRSFALSNFRLIALLPEWIDGRRAAAPKVETALAGALAQAHFRVYDWNSVSSQTPLAGLVTATLTGNSSAGVQVGTRFFANTIVAGRVDAKYSQNNDGILSYIATANLRVIKTDTGQILTAHEYSEKGFGLDRAQAARKALDALAATVATELPAELSAHLPEYPITIRIAGARPGQAAALRQALASLAGVSAVEQVQTPEGLTFRLTSREKPAALGAQIETSTPFEASEYRTFGQ